MRVYQLAINGKTILSVDIDQPAWASWQPKLNAVWLRKLINMALAAYLK
jgi:predicted phosphoadenosine phosphosulfate sulfurtransferase